MSTIPAFYAVLNAVRVLRSNVTNVFLSIGNVALAADGEEGKDSKYLTELQELLSTVNSNLRDVDSVITAINHRYKHDMSVTITQPFSTNTPVQVSLGQVLKAQMVLRGLMIEWIVVKGYDEKVDLWTESRHKVFRKVTENAQAAMLHFYSPILPNYKNMLFFMEWFHSYITLFSDPCKRCSNHLHNFLPPTWRDFRTKDPFHEECKP